MYHATPVPLEQEKRTISIIEHRGNIFAAPVEALVNPVNCVGVMGAGLAAQFKQRFPDNFQHYQLVCRDHDLVLGSVLVHDRGPRLAGPRYIVNFPTKRHWRDPSRVPAIAEGLQALVIAIGLYQIRTIALPRLGCGLGGLTWDPDVRDLIYGHLRDMPDLTTYLYSL